MSNLRTYQHILITGANRGLGLEFVRQYANEAETIYACCRSPENAHELNKLAQSHKNIKVIILDMANEHHITAIAQRLHNQPIDLLINNAGIMRGWPGQPAINKNDWLETFVINTIAPMQVIEALEMCFSPRSVIVNISSDLGSIGGNTRGGGIIYRSSKSALNSACKSLAIDKADKFTTIIMHPGWVKTDMGGTEADLTVQTSITNMRQVLANVTAKQNGQFLNYDGNTIPW